MNILYVHGLASSGNSHTVASLHKLLPDDTIFSPDLPLEPQAVFRLLETYVMHKNIDLVIGTSMGGMFAQKLFGIKKILVNPAFHVSVLMRTQLGVHPFLNPRSNGETQFVISNELCDLYEHLERSQFDHVSDLERKITYGLFGDHDELVNCQSEFASHYSHVRLFHGGHRLDEHNISLSLLPLIDYIRSLKDI